MGPQHRYDDRQQGEDRSDTVTVSPAWPTSKLLAPVRSAPSRMRAFIVEVTDHSLDLFVTQNSAIIDVYLRNFRTL